MNETKFDAYGDARASHDEQRLFIAPHFERALAAKTTFSELARRLGISRRTLYQLKDGSRTRSPDLAMRLSKIIGGRPEHWLMQREFSCNWLPKKNADVLRPDQELDWVQITPHAWRYLNDPTGETCIFKIGLSFICDAGNGLSFKRLTDAADAVAASGAQPRERRCLACGIAFFGRRDALTCSPRCRKRQQRTVQKSGL